MVDCCAAGHRSLAQSRIEDAVAEAPTTLDNLKGRVADKAAGGLSSLDALKEAAAAKKEGFTDAVRSITPASREQVADVAKGLSSLEAQVAGLSQARPMTAARTLTIY